MSTHDEKMTPEAVAREIWDNASLAYAGTQAHINSIVRILTRYRADVVRERDAAWQTDASLMRKAAVEAYERGKADGARTEMIVDGGTEPKHEHGPGCWVLTEKLKDAERVARYETDVAQAEIERADAATNALLSQSAYAELERVELGCPGHFIAVHSCQWRRHTQVNGYRVSSIGDYYDHENKRQTIGSGRKDFFETMVFKADGPSASDSDGCGCVRVNGWCELEGERYATAGEAQAGHERYVAKYATTIERS